MTYSPSGGRPLRCDRKPGQQRGQIVSRKGPLERARGAFVPVLEPEEGGFKRGDAGKIGGGQDLALHDRVVDFDLTQAARVERRENWNHVPPRMLKTPHGLP